MLFKLIQHTCDLAIIFESMALIIVNYLKKQNVPSLWYANLDILYSILKSHARSTYRYSTLHKKINKNWNKIYNLAILGYIST